MPRTIYAATRPDDNPETSIDFQTADALTYRYYMEQKWDSVIYIGKQALKNDIDYYYLRTRLGLSYYALKHYIPAITHLAKAREFDTSDPVVADYLYYACLLANRTEEARILIPSLTRESRPAAESVNRVVEQAGVEIGYVLSSNNTPIQTPDLMGPDSIYGETDLYGNYFYAHAGLKFHISNRIKLTTGYNYLNFSKLKYIQYVPYTVPKQNFDTSFSYNISQNEGYAGLSWYLNKGLRILPAFHFINVRYPNTRVTFDNFAYRFTRTDTSFWNFMAGLTVSKEFGRVTLDLSGSWSNINNLSQKQIGGAITWYPLGNLNLYTYTTLTGFFQKNEKRLLLSQMIGVKITPWFWTEGSFYYGDFTNANILNGLIVYNNSDAIDYKGGVNLIFLAGKHVQLSLIYQYTQKESKQYYFTVNPTTKEVSSKPKILYNPYNTHSIFGGITWKF